jgi:polysaccharide biosynthesis protein PslH
MKILQLCNKVPYPPNDGGAIAVLNFSVSMAQKGHEVCVMAMNTTKHWSDVTAIPEELQKLIHFIYVQVDTRIRPFRLLLNFLFSRQPYNASRFHDRKFSSGLKELLCSQRFDIVQLEGLYMKCYIDLIRKYHSGKIVYRPHNIESEIWKGIAERETKALHKFYLKSLSCRLKKYEQDIVNRYDILLPISLSDQTIFEKMGNIRPVHLTFTNVPEEGFLEVTDTSVPADLFFIGALDWIPNQEGLTWFLEKVWGKLKQDFPDLEFHVAGRNAPELIAHKCREYGAVFHGEIPDAKSFYDQHSIMVVPLFAGSGLRIKIVEAMARSKVIVSTSKGIQGMGLKNEHAVVIEDNPVLMKEHIAELIRNPGKCKEIRQNAYSFAKQNFSSHSIVDKLLYFYREQGIC